MEKEQNNFMEAAELYPENYSFNLSDFALFLSVMKNKRAYECVLRVFLDEPGIVMEEVKVEQVVLNRYGKRAIRLDAWGKTTDDRHVNMEMENHPGNDDVAKRSRFYQGLLDSPLLKSGKRTKIFLNMTSKNGSQELVSMLQYMRNTSLDNPEIKVRDERIVELDRIVSEVKESEEWEAVQMNILEIGISQGENRKLVSLV